MTQKIHLPMSGAAAAILNAILMSLSAKSICKETPNFFTGSVPANLVLIADLTAQDSYFELPK